MASQAQRPSRSNNRRNPRNISSPGGLRAAVYRRVSSEEQTEGFSLDAQTRAIRQYCESYDWRVVQEYADEGKSARTDDMRKRPDFARMLADAEAGMFDVIVVHKLDRFARNLRVLLTALDRLEKCGVSFASVSEHTDYTIPGGRLFVTMLGGLAQWYSDNLSWETKKGKRERKIQGLYNGLLPFGVKKNADGIPVPDPTTYPGLLLAMQQASEGVCDREIALALNAAGYRTTGNRGANPWTKDSVRAILINRFYLGELPDGDGGWLKGRHAPMLDNALFDAVQAARALNNHPARKTRAGAQIYSLSGLAVCAYCGGRIHIMSGPHNRPRVYCYKGRQAEPCQQRCTFLDVYEAQLADYLATFHIPADYREQLQALFRQSQADRDDAAEQRGKLEAGLERLKKQYQWGDVDDAEYRQTRDEIAAKLATLKPREDLGNTLGQAAALLADVPAAWQAAPQEQRSQLARTLFAQVTIKGNRVEDVLPQPDLLPFFRLDYQKRLKVLSGGSDGIRNSDIKLHELRRFPLLLPPSVPLPAAPCAAMPSIRQGRYAAPRTRLTAVQWPEVQARHAAGESLRTLAAAYGVSYEAVRQVAKRRTMAV